MTDSHMTLRLFSPRILRDEIHRNTFITVRFVPVTIVLLTVFTFASMLAARTYDRVRLKPLEGLMGIASSGLSMITAAGLLFAFQVPFITQVRLHLE